MKNLQNFIDGELKSSSSGKTSEVINPATGFAYANAPLSNQTDVEHALKAAANAFIDWRDSTPSERQRALLKIADGQQKKSKPKTKESFASSTKMA